MFPYQKIHVKKPLFGKRAKLLKICLPREIAKRYLTAECKIRQFEVRSQPSVANYQSWSSRIQI
jgi:hypothetical protein